MIRKREKNNVVKFKILVLNFKLSYVTEIDVRILFELSYSVTFVMLLLHYGI